MAYPEIRCPPARPLTAWDRCTKWVRYRQYPGARQRPPRCGAILFLAADIAEVLEDHFKPSRNSTHPADREAVAWFANADHEDDRITSVPYWEGLETYISQILNKETTSIHCLRCGVQIRGEEIACIATPWKRGVIGEEVNCICGQKLFHRIIIELSITPCRKKAEYV